MSVYSVYRFYYGEDFIEQSIRSTANSLDEIFVFWVDRPFGDPKSVGYKGTTYEFPRPIDKSWKILLRMQQEYPQLHVIYDYWPTDMGQFSHLVNDRILPHYPKPDTIVFIENDHVYHERQFLHTLRMFNESGYSVASTHPLEHWRTPLWVMPERKNRLCTMFWNMAPFDAIPRVGRHANPLDFKIGWLPIQTHNFGLCLSDENMFWKHNVALAKSPLVGDSTPRPEWYDIWLNWKPGDTDLGISKGRANIILEVLPFPSEDLPDLIAKKYKLDEYKE